MSDNTAYCVKCRAKTTMKDTQEVKMKNGRPALKGSCSTCGTGVYKILSQK
jgi:RNase P subunit RPR2